jgi:hypothetical protein
MHLKTLDSLREGFTATWTQALMAVTWLGFRYRPNIPITC